MRECLCKKADRSSLLTLGYGRTWIVATCNCTHSTSQSFSFQETGQKGCHREHVRSYAQTPLSTSLVYGRAIHCLHDLLDELWRAAPSQGLGRAIASDCDLFGGSWVNERL
mmetsp:Transcript_20464/g.62392  ORF Transcript_20464/g.62392 Transcript_20464/m.62392 type:complete len:111 (+) Transcript_20464:361-693(+)